MAENMIERVARACCADILARDVADKQTAPSFDDSDSETQDFWRHIARAAIEAMRTPTEAMIEASNREWDGRMSHRSSGAWQAMISAALNESTADE